MIGDHHEIIIFEKYCGAGNVWLASFWSSPRLRRPAKIAVRHVLRPNRSEDWKLLPRTRKNQRRTGNNGLWQDGNTLYQKNFGYTDKEKKLAVDDKSVFEWGSTTKITVWVSVMQLWEEGKIDLKTDIREYLPQNLLKNLKYDKPITMLDLMNHQAGFEDYPCI